MVVLVSYVNSMTVCVCGGVRARVLACVRLCVLTVVICVK